MVMVKAMTIGVSIQLAKDKGMKRFVRWLYDGMWKCKCGAWNPYSADTCLRCGS